MADKRLEALVWPCAVALFFAVSMGPQAVVDGALSLASRPAVAVVSENRLEHVTCGYRFQVQGKSYHGKGYDCGEDNLGQQIAVYYWPTYPGISSNRLPGEVSLSRVLIAMALLIGIVGVALFKARRAKA